MAITNRQPSQKLNGAMILLGSLYISGQTDQTHFDYLILNYIAPSAT